MKKLYIAVIALLMVNGAMAQWVQQNSGTNNSLHSVFFISASNGFAVGEGNTILKTEDGGINWSLVPVVTTGNWTSVFFTSVSTGYITGDHGIILKTIDGGSNWTSQVTDTSYYLKDIYFPTSTLGFIAGYYQINIGRPVERHGIVLRTTDAGATWDTVFTTSVSGELWSVDFPDANTGYVAGEIAGAPTTGVLYRTDDSGDTWEERHTGPPNSIFYSLFFTGIDTGYWVWDNSIYITTDGGMSHLTYSFGANNSMDRISFNNSGVGYAVGFNSADSTGIILKTLDDGATWYSQLAVPFHYFNSVYFLTTDLGYAAGDYGIIYETSNGGGPVGVNDPLPAPGSMKIHPNPASAFISIESQDKGVISVRDISGRQLLQLVKEQPSVIVDVSVLSAGVYVVRLSGEKGVEVGKFVKK